MYKPLDDPEERCINFPRAVLHYVTLLHFDVFIFLAYIIFVIQEKSHSSILLVSLLFLNTIPVVRLNSKHVKKGMIFKMI